MNAKGATIQTSQGWKETPVGNIPNDWTVQHVDEACKVNPDSFSADEWPEETFEYITLSNASEGTISESRTTDTSEAPSRAKRRVRAGDVLVGTVRPKQRSHGFVSREHDRKVCSTGFGVLRSDTSLNDTFLLHEVLFHRFFRQMEAYVAGSGYPAVKLSDLGKHRLVVPPLAEQRKIASVLYAVDQAIQQTEAVRQQAERLKRGLAVELFRRGPNKSESEETRFGPVLTETPVHWKRAKIGDLYAERQLGTTERGTTKGAEHMGLVKMGNLGFGTWNLAEVEQIDRDATLVEKYQLREGDLLFNTRNAPNLVGKTAVWDSGAPAIYDNNLLRLRFNDRIASGHFVNYYLSHSIGRRQLRSRVHGTTSVAAIYWSDLKTVEIPLPPKEEQQEIVEALRSVDATIQQSQRDAARLRRLKRGLMQDLLTGAVRTRDKAIDVLDAVRAHG